ncbi:uncharacterized protein TNIN_438571 [Trichonephila inaurata madagascariensis]|uniref:Uncharacterized protein n=1 Tax=Trichonephila inaurata madagascariensis TaxID=2747483 RepID=A0A8X6XCX1_9ARAC|nr:uncharacterized protein TNIN_438571 [Trichonephila inaurata madagascariensis]
MYKMLFLVIVGIVVTEAIVCTEDYCSRIRCQQVTEDKGSPCVPIRGGPPGCEDGTTCTKIGGEYICAR